MIWPSDIDLSEGPKNPKNFIIDDVRLLILHLLQRGVDERVSVLAENP